MSDMFLKLTGDDKQIIIKGESLAAGHADEIEIHEWTWFLKNPAPYGLGESQATKQTHVDHMKIHKLIDKASVTLINFCAHGKRIAKAALTCRKNAGGEQGVMRVDYLMIELTNVKVEEVRWDGRGAVEHGIPEQVELSFLEFDVTYKMQNANGTLGEANGPFHFDLPGQKGQPGK